MKSFMFFVLGCLTGFVAAIFLSVGLSQIDDSSAPLHGATMFPEETTGNCIGTYKFEIFQVLDGGHALAREMKSSIFGEKPTGLIVLFLADESFTYYDSMSIYIPQDKCARQIGTYRYTSNSDIEKTVPIVKITDR